jgi:GSH-dependent disulfide-bond oxidoreductase
VFSSSVLILIVRLAAVFNLWFIPLQGLERGALILFACLPPAVFNFMLADKFQVEPNKVASTVIVGHLLSLAFCHSVFGWHSSKFSFIRTKESIVIKFYFHPSPNPLKIALYLEETGEPYELIPVDTRKGEQHSDSFKAINPNAKTPAMLDDDIRVFDSNAMLLYLAEKIGKFVPAETPKNKAEMYSWLMFVATGIGPYCGQAVHFKHFAPEPKEYAVNRYDFEAWRHWNLINDHLAHQPYMMGNDYSIVDMSVWGWARVVPFVLGADAWEKLPHVKRLLDEINARPAAQRAEALKTKFAFKTEMDEDARKKLFPSNERLKAAGA